VSGPISHRAQTAAVNWLTGWTLREIDTLFSSHELPPPVEQLDERRWAVVGTSVRRELAARYHAAIDTRDATLRAKLLRAYDEIIRTAESFDSKPTALIGALRADGVTFTDDGLIAAPQLAIERGGVLDEDAASLAAIRDPNVLDSTLAECSVR
jgi:hypothetical protein